MQPNPEVGRELTAAELVHRTIYVLCKEQRPYGATMWFVGQHDDLAEFLAGVVGTRLFLRVDKDGLLFDDSDARIHIHEYLGLP